LTPFKGCHRIIKPALSPILYKYGSKVVLKSTKSIGLLELDAIFFALLKKTPFKKQKQRFLQQFYFIYSIDLIDYYLFLSLPGCRTAFSFDTHHTKCVTV
jgi:hypothetical protein